MNVVWMSVKSLLGVIVCTVVGVACMASPDLFERGGVFLLVRSRWFWVFVLAVSSMVVLWQTFRPRKARETGCPW